MSNSVTIASTQATAEPPVSAHARPTTAETPATQTPAAATAPTGSSPTPPPSPAGLQQQQHREQQQDERNRHRQHEPDEKESAPGPATTGITVVPGDDHVISPPASALSATAPPTSTSSVAAPLGEPQSVTASSANSSPASEAATPIAAGASVQETPGKVTVQAPMSPPPLQSGEATAPIMDTPRHQLVSPTAPPNGALSSVGQNSAGRTPLESLQQQLSPDSSDSPAPLTPAPSVLKRMGLSPALVAGTPMTSAGKFNRAKESRRTFTAEDGKTYFLPKCVHFRAESNKHARSSLHLQLSAGLYLCNGVRCSEKGGNVDFKASHVVTKDEVLVLRAFRDLMGWRPHGSPAAPLHELLCAEIFRLYEKSRRSSATAPSDDNGENKAAASASGSGSVPVPDISDDEVISISPGAHKFGDDLPTDAVVVNHKAGYLRRINKEKRRRCTEIYHALAQDPAVLSGTLTEATGTATRPQYLKPVKPTASLIDIGGGPPIAGSATGATAGGGATGLTAGVSGHGTHDTFGVVGVVGEVASNHAGSREAEGDAAANRAALSSLLSTLASRCGPAPTLASTTNRVDGGAELAGAKNLAGERGLGGEGPVAKRPRTEGLPSVSDTTKTAGGREGTGDGAIAPSVVASSSEGHSNDAAVDSKDTSGSSAADAFTGAAGVSPDNATAPVFQSEEAASAARRQVWRREVKANDARLEAVKQDAERVHSARMRELMNWIVDEEAGKHAGMGMDGGPGLAPWNRR